MLCFVLSFLVSQLWTRLLKQLISHWQYRNVSSDDSGLRVYVLILWHPSKMYLEQSWYDKGKLYEDSHIYTFEQQLSLQLAVHIGINSSRYVNNKFSTSSLVFSDSLVVFVWAESADRGWISALFYQPCNSSPKIFAFNSIYKHGQF